MVRAQYDVSYFDVDYFCPGLCVDEDDSIAIPDSIHSTKYYTAFNDTISALDIVLSLKYYTEFDELTSIDDVSTSILLTDYEGILSIDDTQNSRLRYISDDSLTLTEEWSYLVVETIIDSIYLQETPKTNIFTDVSEILYPYDVGLSTLVFSETDSVTLADVWFFSYFSRILLKGTIINSMSLYGKITNSIELESAITNYLALHGFLKR